METFNWNFTGDATLSTVNPIALPLFFSFPFTIKDWAVAASAVAAESFIGHGLGTAFAVTMSIGD